MTTPSAVVFDLGKVLVDFDFAIAARRIAARSTLPLSEFQHLFATSPLLLQYETGHCTSQEFYREVAALTGFAGDFAEFSRDFADIFSPIRPMIALHAQLRSREVPTYILSNTNELAIDSIRANFPFFGHFSGYVFSYEHRAMKPDPKLYEVIEELSGRKGSQLLYLDDRLENVAAAELRGWQVIHHSDPEATRARMQSLGLLPPRPEA